MMNNDLPPLESDRWRNVAAILLDSFNALLARMRTYFLTGVILLVPVAVTLFIMFQLFLWADGFLGESVSRAIGYRIPGLGLFLTILVFVVIGIVGQNMLGKRLWRWIEYSLESLPVVRSLYVGIKQVSDILFQQRKSDFQRVVLIEYPRKDVWVIGFVTNDQALWSKSDEFQGKQMVSVFVPTTPNPTSGFLLLVDRTHCVDTSIGIEEAMKLVISGGLVQPKSVGLPQPPMEEFTIPH